MVLAAALVALTAPALAADSQRTTDVVYGRKFGMALTLDVFRPAEPNGHAILWTVSGAWTSARENIHPSHFRALLDRGYVVFAVLHGSSPRFKIFEAAGDVRRAVRFVRHEAGRFGVRGDRIGIAGISSGAHLALLVAAAAAPGIAGDLDPVNRQSAVVQAVAGFFPPTDFLNYGAPGENAVGIGRLEEYKAAFGARSDTPEGREQLGREISPIFHVTPAMPPTLLIHGTADPLIPISQSERFVGECTKAGAVARLVAREGGKHGWEDMTAEFRLVADWFDTHLRGMRAAP